MNKRISWYKPRSQRRHKKKAPILPANLPALLLLILLAVAAGGKWLAGRESRGAANADPTVAGCRPAAILQKAVGDVIPGLESPPVIGRAALGRCALDAFCLLTGADPRDPRTILNFELRAGAPVSLPALSPSSPVQISGDPEKPGYPGPLPVTGAEIDPAPGSRPKPRSENGPVILIYHTHITESFLPSSQVLFTENMDLSVCRLGKALTGLLEEKYGFTVIHHREIYDLPRRYAYEKARPAVEALLQGQEEINLVLDIHRDGVARASTTAELEGNTMGKILFVVGCNHPGYETNLKFTLRLQQELESLLPGISRGVRRQNFVYNQDLHPYSILVEIAGHENSMEEALGAVPYLAEAVARAYMAFFEMEE